MNKILSVFFGVLLCFFFVNSVDAAFINGSFETGDLTGWDQSVTEGISVISKYNNNSISVDPAQGIYFVLIDMTVFNSGNDAFIHQDLYLNEGDQISGKAAFYNFENNDTEDAWITIYDYNAAQHHDINWHRIIGHFPWTDWDWTAPSDGNYIVMFGVQSSTSNSVAMFDMNTIAVGTSDETPYFIVSFPIADIELGESIYFDGYAWDDNGLRSISMNVTGPVGTYNVFSESISGTFKSLDSYYFNSSNTDYANMPGTYTVTLTIEDSSGKTASQSFSVTVVEVVQETWYRDFDNDGYGDPDVSIKAASQPSGYVLDNSDCLDTANDIHPGATEIRGDGIDQDCDSNDLPCLVYYYRDFDNDGFVDEYDFKCESDPFDGYKWNDKNKFDCDDNEWSINPDAIEIRGDGIDQNCDDIDPPSPEADGTVNIYGLFVGIDDPFGGKLKGSKNIKAVKEAIICAFGEKNNTNDIGNINILLRERSKSTGYNKDDFKRDLELQIEKADLDDLFIFYSSSHGEDPSGRNEGETTYSNDDEYLHYGDTADYLISDDDLTKMLLPYNDINKWVIIDACYSGGFWGNGEESYNSGGDLDSLDKIEFLSSTSETQESMTAQFEQRTELSKAIEESLNCTQQNQINADRLGLGNANNFVTLSEIKNYIEYEWTDSIFGYYIKPLILRKNNTIEFELANVCSACDNTYKDVIVLSKSSPNHIVISGNDSQIYGNAAANQLTIESGAKAELMNFPGQNSIQIQSSSDLFTVSRSGTIVTFQGTDGTLLKIPATTDVQTIKFTDRGPLTLSIHDNMVMLDDQEINLNPVAISRPDEINLLKPIIYLYPESIQEVYLSFEKPDSMLLTTTYPEYSINGWNVLAYPDGTLYDMETGLEFYALYWEGYTPKTGNYETGFVIKSEHSATFLETSLEQLGLTRREANEFIVYWLPELEKSPYNFIYFSTEEWENDVPLEIIPEPETLIRFMMYYLPLEYPIQVEPQMLESPVRIGFTVVEWGGGIIE